MGPVERKRMSFSKSAPTIYFRMIIIFCNRYLKYLIFFTLKNWAGHSRKGRTQGRGEELNGRLPWARALAAQVLDQGEAASVVQALVRDVAVWALAVKAEASASRRNDQA